MKKVLLYGQLLILLLAGGSAYSQKHKADSLLEKIDNLKIPSLNLPSLSATDSLSSRELSKIDSTFKLLNYKVDSLHALKLPADRYQKKLDSVQSHLQKKLSYKNKLDSTSGKWKNKGAALLSVQDSLQTKITQRTTRLEEKLETKMSFLDSIGGGDLKNDLNMKGLGGKMPDKAVLPGQSFSMGGEGVQLPSANVADINIPKTSLTNPAGEVGEKAKELQNLPKQKLDNVGPVDEIKETKERLGDIQQEIGKAKEIEKEVKDIKANGLEKAESMPKELENAAANIDEVKGLQTETQKATTMKNSLQQYQELMKAMQNPDSLKKRAKPLGGELVEHFAGKEEKLKAGIVQLDQLKKKYKVIEDSRYLPKHAPNEMKGKPMRERIVPGLSFQFYNPDRLAFDVNPYVAYKLSGRFRPGIGFTYRVETLGKAPFVKSGKVFGYRIFNDLRLYGTFYLHTEFERLHFDPEVIPKYRFPIEESVKEWKAKLNVGLMRTYKISRRFDGQAQLLYNALELKNFPQTRNTSIRFGFEYKMGKGLKRKR